MEEVRRVAADAVSEVICSRYGNDRMLLKKRVKDDLTKFLYYKTKRKPMILPVIMDV